MICPMFPTRWSVNPKTQECTEVPDDCRFCSEETEVRMVRASDIYSHKLVLEQQRTPRGFFCNNHPISETGWIVDRHYCPARWGLRSGLDRIKKKPEKKVGKKKVVKKPVKVKTVKKKPVVKKKVTKQTGQRTLFPVKGGKKK